VAAWRELVAAAGDRYASDLAMGARGLSGHWSDELKLLEVNLAKLEALVGATGTNAASKTVWKPAPQNASEMPRVEHTRSAVVRPGEPLRLTARVTAPSGIATVRLRYRHVTQFEDYKTLDMTRVGDSDEFVATVPGDFIVPQWDFMYFMEATARDGHGVQWPDLVKGAPYVVIQLTRD
jgi:hypothetical protein